jgi:AsmA-like protein
MAGRVWLQVTLIALAVVVVLAATTLLLLPLLIDTPVIHAYIGQAATQAVGRPVKFNSLSISLLPLPNVRLKGLEVADEPRFGTAPILRVGEVRLGLRIKPLLSLRIELATLTLEGAQVELVEEGGRWNVASLAAASTPSRPSPRTVPGIPGRAAVVGSVTVSSLRLKDASIHVRRRGVKDGDLHLEGLDVTVSGVGGPELDIRGQGRLEPGALKLRDIGATVGLRGELPIKASLGIEGADIAPLARAFVLASPAVSGPVKGKLQVSGTPARLGATGQLDLSRVTLSQSQPQCPAPPRRELAFDDVRVPVLLKPTTFESAPLQARLGRGTVAFHVKAGLDEASPLVTLGGITISGVELQPVLQGYLCQRYAISGPLELTGALSMRAGDLWRTMNGAGQFKIGAGKVIGEGARQLVREVLLAQGAIAALVRGDLKDLGRTSLQFSSITGTYRIVNGILRTDDALYQAKEMTMSATGSYGLADGRTDMALVITQGDGQFRAQLTGSGGSFRVVPTGVKVKDPAAVRKFLDRLMR